jgi:hypothetical protein
MPEYLHPGVYVEEIERGPKPIEGVPTSTAAFLGETERGPTLPQLVTSYKDYQRWFGGVFGDTKFMPYAVSGFFENGGKRLYVCRITNVAATPAEAVFGPFIVRAVGGGAWGKRVYAQVADSTTLKPGPGNTMVPVGFKLRVAYYAAPPVGNPADWFNDPTKGPFPSAFETFDDLDTDEKSPNYWDKRTTNSSAFVELIRTGPPGSAPAKQIAQLATNGADGAAPDIADYQGLVQLPQRALPQGLAALELDPYRDVALVYAPGAPVLIAKAVVAHCEKLRFRFAVVDPDKSVSAATVGNFQPRSGTSIGDTQYAALYYPWLAVSDPQTGARKEIPPGGHVLGVYARTDSERGVFKAPANETLRGVMELLADTDDGTQDVLNPRGINAIRQFPERGIRVWGARTLSSDPSWRYINVRRLFNFVEESIMLGTQWVVFEPNDQALWQRVRRTINGFLTRVWRDGALFGTTPEEAFYVKCDAENNPPETRDVGQLIVEIGISPVKPAEFVIFRISQFSGGAGVEE